MQVGGALGKAGSVRRIPAYGVHASFSGGVAVSESLAGGKGRTGGVRASRPAVGGVTTGIFESHDSVVVES